MRGIEIMQDDDSLVSRQISLHQVIEINEWNTVRTLVRGNTGVLILPGREAGSRSDLWKLRICCNLSMSHTQLIYRGDRKSLSSFKEFLALWYRQCRNHTGLFLIQVDRSNGLVYVLG